MFLVCSGLFFVLFSRVLKRHNLNQTRYLFYIFILKGHLIRLALMVISGGLYFSIVINCCNFLAVFSCKCQVQINMLLLLVGNANVHL